MDDKWILSTIANGYKLEFQSLPPFSGIRETVVNANNQAILNLEIEILLQKAVIEPVPYAQRLQGFYSTFFLVPKKVGRSAGCDKFETPQSVSQNSTFQDGYSEDCSKSSQERRLGNINRLERRIFPRVNSPKAQEVSSFLHSGQSISVPSTSFRSQNLAESFYQDSGSGCSSSKNAKHQIGYNLDDWLALNARRRFLLENREAILSLLS